MTHSDLPRRLQQLAVDVQTLNAGKETGEFDRTRDLLQTILDFHRAAVAQLLDLIRREGNAGRQILENATQDGLVANLLLLHGLHPADLETRTCQALDQVRPFLKSQGADVELVAVADDSVRLQLHRSGSGYPASTQMLQSAIEEAVAATAPDVRLIEFVAPGSEGAPANTRLSLPVLAHSGSRGAEKS
jgi:Fe-S cluster biogenesis protein NfuA